MRQTIIHPWVSLLMAAAMFGFALIGGAFLTEGVTKQVVTVPVRDRFNFSQHHGVLTASREKHPYIYFGSLAFWGVVGIGACVGGVYSCLQAAYDRKWRKEGKVFQPRPRGRI
jgi:hypothetical protein